MYVLKVKVPYNLHDIMFEVTIIILLQYVYTSVLYNMHVLAVTCRYCKAIMHESASMLLHILLHGNPILNLQ